MSNQYFDIVNEGSKASFEALRKVASANAEAAQKLANYQAELVNQLVESSTEYGNNLSNVKSFEAFVAFQNEAAANYSKKLLENSQKVAELVGEIKNTYSALMEAGVVETVETLKPKTAKKAS